MPLYHGISIYTVDFYRCPFSPPPHADGHDVLAPINRLTPLFDHVVYSLDWHPPDHVSFFSNLELRRDQLLSDDAASLRPLSVARFSGPPPFNQTLWPDHCVQGTHGAQLHKDLKVNEPRGGGGRGLRGEVGAKIRAGKRREEEEEATEAKKACFEMYCSFLSFLLTPMLLASA